MFLVLSSTCSNRMDSLGAQQWEPSCGAGAGGGTAEIKPAGWIRLVHLAWLPTWFIQNQILGVRKLLPHSCMCVCVCGVLSIRRERGRARERYTIWCFYLAEVGCSLLMEEAFSVDGIDTASLLCVCVCVCGGVRVWGGGGGDLPLHWQTASWPTARWISFVRSVYQHLTNVITACHRREATENEKYTNITT